MDILEVRFLKATQSKATGNELYLPGTAAHFYADQANILVSRGDAELVTEQAPLLADYSSMTVKQLRALAKSRGIAIKPNARKADIVKALR